MFSNKLLCRAIVLAALTIGTPFVGGTAHAAQEKKAEKTKAKKEEKPPKISVDRKPYKVLVNVTVSAHPGMTNHDLSALRDDIANKIERTWGCMWVTKVQLNDWICVEDTIRRMQPETMSARFGQQYDKVMLIHLDPETFTLTVREWDYRSNTLTTPASGSTHRLAAVPNLAAELLVEVFQPVLVWRRTDKDPRSSYLELTLKAANFPPADPIANQIRPGDVVIPFIRHFEKKNPTQVKKIQPLLLTFIVIDAVDREVVGGTIIMHGPASPFGRSSRNAEQFALRRRPRHKSTKVKMVLRNRTDKPLLCHRVVIVSKLKYRDEELGPSSNLISDRYGKVQIPTGSYPTYWVYVYSGKLLLARVPYAPGLLAEETIEMPDDSMRLLVEGEVDLLKGRLINHVARGAVHRSAAMAFSKKGNKKGVLKEVADLEKMPGLKFFEDEVTTFREPAIQRAEAARNRVSKRRIERVCGEIGNVLRNYFDPEKEKKFKEQLDRVFRSEMEEAPKEDDA